MKIVLTGAGGFLGRNLVPKLLDQRLEVIALTSQKEKLLAAYGHEALFSVSDRVPEDADVLLNCAFPRIANGEQMARGLDYIADVFRQAKAAGIGAVINISSQSVYSEHRPAAAVETMTAGLESLYAVGKYGVELLTNTLFEDRPHTNLRMASLIGPGFDQRLPNVFAKQVLAGNDLRVVDSEQVFGYLDVRDAAEAITRVVLSAADSPAWEEVYNLGTPKAYTLLQIAESVAKHGAAFCGREIRINVSGTADRKSSEVDPACFCEAFSWKPCYSLDESVQSIFQALTASDGVCVPG